MSGVGLALLLSTAVAVPPAASQARRARSCPVPPEPDGRTVEITPGKRYDASGLHRFVFGEDYRKLWTTPIRVPVLDLGTYDGGLKVVEEGGGMQTSSLKLKSANGGEYRFRSVDKDPKRLLPRALRATVAGKVLQDQTASLVPGGLVIANAVVRDAGVLTTPAQLFVMPDDERLGEFRKRFAGMLGTLERVPGDEERPLPGFQQIDKVESTAKLLQHLAKHPEERIDSRSFLRARLVDLLIGDWDRHSLQWRWGRSQGVWLAIPHDRDQAFTRFEGLALDLVRPFAARLVRFDGHYPSIPGLTFNSRAIDRRLLGPLAWPDWQAIVGDVQKQLSDAAIETAVCRLPPEQYRLVGPWMAAALERRRELLPRMAAEFYRRLAEQAEVHGSEGDDVARLERQPDGTVRLTIALAGAAGEPYVDRVFEPKDTREVRVFLENGDDRVTCAGRGPHAITLRVIGGEGNDSLDDSAGCAIRFYDASGENGVRQGPGTHVETRSWNIEGEDFDTPVRDWGRSLSPVPWVSYYHDVGALIGAGLQLTTYGFRQYPYAHQNTVRLGYATGPGLPRLEYLGDFRRRGALEPRAEVIGIASGFDVVRFYGFGNERRATGPDSASMVDQQQYLLTPALVALVPKGTVSFGPLVRFTRTRLEPGEYIAALRPYGIGGFGQAGARANLRLDLRDRPDGARKGLLLTTGGSFYPPVWSVKSAFGQVRGSVATYVPVPVPGGPSIAVRVGGQKVWGRYPFHEAAFIGSWDTVRGLPQNRYAGDASVFANTELRVPLTGVNLFFAGKLGVFALADVGRVYLEGERSDRWHRSAGGGAWLSFDNGSRIITAAAARSEGNLGLYLYGGMLF